MKLKYVAIFLVLLCCLMGAASAAEDISVDAVDDAIDDVVITDEAVDADLLADDIISAEPADADSEADQSDVSIETNDEEGNTRASGTATVSDWTTLRNKSQETGTDYTITLNGPITIGTGDILFKNNAIIQGNANSYITGNAAGRIPFKSTTNSLSITFRNVKFQNINCQMLIQLQSTGISKIENCTFINITTGNDHHSVLYNTWGTMNVTGCNFTNCTTGYGVITNYNWMSQIGVILNVKNSRFENNSALYEPGAINNCGKLTVYNSTFIGNHAELWAGAIHTHSNANTVINKSYFQGNTAEWNGGALYTYSVLEVYNSCFVDNNCSSNTGGGAIGAYNYGSSYNIIVDNCTFKRNNNLASEGRGGAISTLNGGHLNVYDSTFISNSADIGQAICAYNENIENGTSDQPYLSIEGNTFINHTGTNDTVFIGGVAESFEDNEFINSPQTQYSFGSGNIYNSIVVPMKKANLLAASPDDEDVLGDAYYSDITYVNASSEYTGSPTSRKYKGITIGDSWERAFASLNYGISYINNGGTILIAGGVYTELTQAYISDKFTYSIIFKGFEDGVIFNFTEYNLDLGSRDSYGEMHDGVYPVNTLITHDNIVFDCDVKVGSKNFKFVNCTFNKGLEITRDYVSDDICNITFENCIFANPKSDIVVADNNNVIYNGCTFPVTAVDSVVDISSPEKGTVVVTLTDNSTNPIAGATFKYTVNGGEEKTATTGDDGKYAITGLTGEVTVAVNYEGNESFNGITGSKSFNFTDEPAPSNDTNGSNSTPVPPAKVATKLTASKVTATYNVAKKLVITLKDANGKALANKKVTVKVGSISKTLKTNNKGQVSLNVATLVPKTYTATVKFAGDSSYKASSVKPKVVVSKAKPKITAKAKTFKVKVKTKKYTVTLKNNKGKVLKKVKLTLKVGKKTYKATTNSKGKATFKITKLTKKGKYTATVKFAGSKYYKALSKKVKITVKK